MSSLLYGPGSETPAVVVLNSADLGRVGVTAALSVLVTAVVLLPAAALRELGAPVPDVLHVRGLSVAYGTTTVLHAVDLSVGQSEVLALLGAQLRASPRCSMRSPASFRSAAEGRLGTRQVAAPNRADRPNDVISALSSRTTGCGHT